MLKMKYECSKIKQKDTFTNREIIFLIVFAFLVLCFGIYEMAGCRHGFICVNVWINMAFGR